MTGTAGVLDGAAGVLDGAARAFEATAGTPAGALLPFVRRYVGYRYSGFRPGVHLGLPSRYLAVVISLSDPTRVALEPGGRATGYATLASGFSTGPAFIEHDGHQFGVQLAVTPAGARALFGVPAAALASTVVGLEELLGPAAAELPERMASAVGWPQRFTMLDEVLVRRMDCRGGPAPEVSHAWRLVGASGGTARVDEIAAEVGWSRRHLSARFVAEFGVSPKDAARIVRFERSKLLLRRGELPTLAAVAAACGYFDQPHLAREWRDLAGVAPSAWLAGDDLAAATE